MLRSKVFLKKTKRGGVMKIVREHYLRDDIWCGSEVCEICTPENHVLIKEPKITSDLCDCPHYILPDTNVVLHQMDVLDHPTISNVIILQTVLEEVRHRSAPAYKRIKDLINNPDKHFYTFVNEFHKDTYIEREPGETSNDRNDRAIRTATQWYSKHLQMKIVLLTNDAENKAKAKSNGILAFTVAEYVKSLKDCPELVDKLSHSHVETQGKAEFPEHLPLSEIQKGIKSGKYLQGSFMTSRDNYLEANVSVQDKEEMVFIQGAQNLNRAVHEDVVAIEMLPRNQWTCPSSLVLADDKGEEEEEDKENELSDTSARKTSSPKLPTGRVVGIIKRKWRQYCGILQPSPLKTATRHLFVPTEKRIPKIRIETRQADILAGCRIVVAIDSWPRNSRYPLGHFVRKLGAVGDKDTENEVLLLEHDVPHAPFSEAVLKFLPKMPWSITEEDLKKRLDLRSTVICSVDPPGCTDIDDALHCYELENGNLCVGVHIADVSHFIRPGNALDEEAAKRGTTVYLIDKRIDMVPELLSSNLCSLRSNVDRFAFSVIWEMTHDAEIVDVKYTKSVICSKASLTYAEAQMLIDDASKQDGVTKGLRLLNKLAKILKQRRIESGALTLASQEVRFHIDSETHDPIDVQTKELRDTNSMVEEFMLLANITVAKKIYEEFPNCACLRRHPAPPPSNFDPVIKAAESKGFKMCVDTGKDLARSLDNAQIIDHPYFNTMLRILTTRCMMQALYFCSGMFPYSEFVHYGLAAPIYTHFTSPIRRYSDIIVHRLLAVAIGADASYPDLLDKKKTQNLCNNLNFRHRMAQYAGRASVALHTQLFFKNRVVQEEGYVLWVRKNALQVLIPKYGLEGNVYLKKGDEPSAFVYDEEANTQTIGDIVIGVFDKLVVEISIDASNVQHQKLALKLIKPHIEQLQDASDSQPPKKKQKSS